MKTTLMLVALSLFSISLAAQDESGAMPVDLAKAFKGAIPQLYAGADVPKKDNIEAHFYAAQKDDARSDFRAFGLRPTLLILADLGNAWVTTTVGRSTVSSHDDKKEAANMAALARDVQDLGRRLEKRKLALDVWIVLPEHWQWDGPSLKAAGVKDSVVFVYETESMRNLIPGCFLGDMANAGKDAVEKSAAYNSQWMWMDKPGVVSAIGKSFKGSELDDLLTGAEKQYGTLLTDKKCADILKFIAQCQHEKAAKLCTQARVIGKDGKPVAGEAAVEAINARASLVAAWLRNIDAGPALEKKFLPEAAETLELIASYLSGTPEGEVVTKEIADLKAQPQYATCVKARKEYQEIKRKLKAIEPQAPNCEQSREWYEARGRQYETNLQPLLKEMRKFNEKYGDTPYAIEFQNDYLQWYDKKK